MKSYLIEVIEKGPGYRTVDIAAQNPKFGALATRLYWVYKSILLLLG